MHACYSNMSKLPRRRRQRMDPLALAALLALALAPAAHAQQAGVPVQQQPIQQQMSPEQFKAAGLDRLDPEQLENLNAWLNRTLAKETAKAADTATQKVKDDNRGFFSFGTIEPISGRLSGEFRGFGQGRSYTLDNGQVWQQIDGTTLSGVRLDSPQVKITPAKIGNVWYMAVGNYNTRAKVERVK